MPRLNILAPRSEARFERIFLLPAEYLTDSIGVLYQTKVRFMAEFRTRQDPECQNQRGREQFGKTNVP